VKKISVGILAATALILLSADGLRGQLLIGVHGSYVSGIGTGATSESVGGTKGVGGRLGIGIGSAGIRLLGTVDMFSPDCGSEDCEFKVSTVNLIYDLTTSPSSSRYFGAGIVVQKAGGEASIIGDRSEWGINLMAGFTLSGGNLTPFVEARYQLMQEFDNHFALSAGLTLSTGSPRGRRRGTGR